MEYLPFGETLIEEHLNSNNSPYKFNAKEFDAETGNYYYGARYYDPKFSIWLNVDPLAEETMDSYGYVWNNPLKYIDPTGMSGETVQDDYIFKQTEQGDYIFTGEIIRNDQPDRVVLQNENGSVTGSAVLNDQANDGNDIENGFIRVLNVISETDIDSDTDRAISTRGSEGRYSFISRESRPQGNEVNGVTSQGLLDFSSTSDLVQRGTLHIAGGTAYNDKDFGNFLWGNAGRKLGFSVGTLQLGAHANNLFNGSTDNLGISTGIFDSATDQNAIRNGYFHPNPQPVYDSSLYFDTRRNPGALAPWNKN